MFIDLLKSRRSIRKFQDKEVEKEKIDTILKSVLLAPSSRGRRPWEFIAVTDKNLLAKLSESREHGSQFLAKAPLVVVVIADPDVSDVWVEDASIVSAFICLTAQSLDLGSCWIQVRQRLHSANETTEDYIKKILGIPQKYKVENLVAIGYPAEEKPPYDEKGLPYDKLHFNKY